MISRRRQVAPFDALPLGTFFYEQCARGRPFRQTLRNQASALSGNFWRPEKLRLLRFLGTAKHDIKHCRGCFPISRVSARFEILSYAVGSGGQRLNFGTLLEYQRVMFCSRSDPRYQTRHRLRLQRS
jgi:hypothetical protein